MVLVGGWPRSASEVFLMKLQDDLFCVDCYFGYFSVHFLTNLPYGSSRDNDLEVVEAVLGPKKSKRPKSVGRVGGWP